MDNNKNNKFKKPEITDIAISLSEEKVKLQIKKSRTARTLYIIGGSISLGLAILGIIVPGLPTTPFALLSAYLYAKSSEKLYNWLLNNKVLGPRVKDYHRKKGVTRKSKIVVIILLFLVTPFFL